MPIIALPVFGNIQFPDEMSDQEILDVIEKEIFKGQLRDYGAGETFAMGLERGFTTSARTLAGGRSDEVTPDYEDPITGMMGTAPAKDPVETDEDKELRFRIARDQNAIAGYGGQILGNIADPAGFAIPFGKAATVGQLVKQGIAAGTVGGVLEPTYEEFGDSRFQNIAAGAVGGGLITGAIGVAFKKKLFPEQTAKVEADSGSPTPTGAVKGVDEEGNPIIQAGEVETPPASATEPDIKPTSNPNPLVQEEEIFNLPTIPQDLGTPQPRFGKAQIQWETDLDNLLYTVGNPASKSKRHDDYVSYLQQALKLPEEDVLKLAKQVRDEVIQTGKDTLKEAALKGQKDVDAFQFKMSKALDNHYFPVTKGLDDPSTFVYNYGKAMMPDVRGKVNIGKLNMGSPQIQQLVNTVKTIDPQATTADIFGAARGYSIILDTMKSKLGRQFKPRSFEDVYANKLDEDSWRTLHDNGNFDGCP
jgi:hypothetical protein